MGSEVANRILRICEIIADQEKMRVPYVELPNRIGVAAQLTLLTLGGFGLVLISNAPYNFLLALETLKMLRSGYWQRQYTPVSKLIRSLNDEHKCILLYRIKYSMVNVAIGDVTVFLKFEPLRRVMAVDIQEFVENELKLTLLEEL